MSSHWQVVYTILHLQQAPPQLEVDSQEPETQYIDQLETLWYTEAQASHTTKQQVRVGDFELEPIDLCEFNTQETEYIHLYNNSGSAAASLQVEAGAGCWARSGCGYRCSAGGFPTFMA
jgi:hypothetical protein